MSHVPPRPVGALPAVPADRLAGARDRLVPRVPPTRPGRALPEVRRQAPCPATLHQVRRPGLATRTPRLPARDSHWLHRGVTAAEATNEAAIRAGQDVQPRAHRSAGRAHPPGSRIAGISHSSRRGRRSRALTARWHSSRHLYHHPHPPLCGVRILLLVGLVLNPETAGTLLVAWAPFRVGAAPRDCPPFQFARTVSRGRGDPCFA